MAQTGYKCFRDGIKAVPRDPMPTVSLLPWAWRRTTGGVVCLLFGLRHALQFFSASPHGCTALPQRALQGTGWPGIRVLQPCCLLTLRALCCRQGTEVCVSWKSSGNKVRGYALCRRCTCWSCMKIPREAAGQGCLVLCCGHWESWGYLLLRRREADKSFMRPKQVSERCLLEKKWGRNDTNTLVFWFTYSCQKCCYSKWMWTCIPLPKEVKISLAWRSFINNLHG